MTSSHSAFGSMVALALVAGLSGCADAISPGYPLSRTVHDCLARRPHFVDVWGCVQTRYASGQMGESDPRLAAFLKLGDGLAGRVSEKTMTDTEAKTQLAIGAERLDKG